MKKPRQPQEPEVVARIRDYRQTFGTQAGRRVLGDLRRSYGRRSSFDENPYKTAFQEGERSVYLKIEAMLKMSEEELDRWVEQYHNQQVEVDRYDA